MEKKEIFDLIKKFERSELTALEYEADGDRLRLEKTEKRDGVTEELLRQLLSLVAAGTKKESEMRGDMLCAGATENTSGPGAPLASSDSDLRRGVDSPGISPESPATSPSPDLSGGIATPETVKAPLVGIFYRAAAPGAKPFVEIGDTVKKGEVMCIIEAMKVMNEIKAPCNLTVTKVLGVDGELVDCGRTLFEVEKC